MGPTASGKTPLAVQLVQQFPFEIISVDSAMIYRDMNIGTAKPDAETLKIAPHRLINIIDPAENYSAGDFRRDVLREIAAIHQKNKVPLLVGGTMMYFKILLQGIAELPQANQTIRTRLQKIAEDKGWESLHDELQHIDPLAAKHIHHNDSQRIQRALEVFELTGKPISAWQHEMTHSLADYEVIQLAIIPADRQLLHVRIAERFEKMLAQGFEAEVAQLYHRGDLSKELPSMRAVGYRQMWEFLSDDITFDVMREKTIAATRQLAKRQLTWLRSWPELQSFADAELIMEWMGKYA
jgi:tRNA dimethylallyltransferase